MAGRRRIEGKAAGKARPRNAGGGNMMSQFGLMDMPDLSDLGGGDDIDDSDGDDASLENELMAIMSGKVQPRATKRPKPQAPTIHDINAMAADCMKDIESDGDDDDDDDVSGDEDLMAELQSILPSSPPVIKDTHPPPLRREPSKNSLVNTLEERLTMYKNAEAAAKSLGDTSKSKRFGRGIKTLEGLIKSAERGQSINEENIPPVVAIPKDKPPEKPIPKEDEAPSLPSPPPSVQPTETTKPMIIAKPQIEDKVVPEDPTTALLVQRRNQYKMAALQAKKKGDNQMALKYVRTAKQFDAVISASGKGQPVDLSNMPPPPPEFQENKISANSSVQPPVQNKVTNVPDTVTAQDSAHGNEQFQNSPIQIPDEPEDPSLFGAPPPPSTIMEALHQRLEKFRSTLEAAQSEGNSSKARRIGRIVKQYEDAIKRYKAGKPVDFEELATPPGYGPIPTEQNKKVESTSPTVPVPDKPAQPASSQVTPSRPAPPAPPPRANKSTAGSGRNPKLGTRTSSFMLDKQLNFLLERQQLFKKAALECKKKGDVQQAKEYLRMSKGIEPMIEATRSGLPIDATTIPTPPQIEEDYVVIEKSDFAFPEEGEENEELYRRLERELTNQIGICQSNKDHFLKQGDVPSASKFEKLAHESRKDLDVIKHLWKLGESLPRFHYETRVFSIVRCHTDLLDSDFEVSVERGINLPGKPTELDSYVKVTFAFPTDTVQQTKTHTVKDTNNPEYKEAFKFKIDRKSRSLARFVKKRTMDFEVWSRGGFLRSDVLLGTANVKLSDLEKKCTIHDSFELMRGRKSVAGKLELKLRLRDPLLMKEIEEVKEKWLVIGS